MPTPPLSDERCLEGLRLVREHGSTWEAQKATGIDRRTLDHRIKKATERGLDGSVPKPSPPGRSIHGVSTLYDAEGQIRAQWVKEKAEPSAEDIAEAMKDALAEYEPPPRDLTPTPPEVLSDLATVYIAADWHLALLSWSKETGHNYDLKIANRVIRSAMTRLAASTPPSEQAIILGLGDLMHADNYDNMTARSGHILDVDGRYPRVLKSAADILIYTVDLALQKHQKVLVRNLAGNHDDQSAIAVSLALSMYFRNEPRVEIDDDPGRFWWWSWGSVLLGATHGDKTKMRDLPLIMASRSPDAWGRAKFRHIYTGHIHTQTGIEMSGVTVESFQTPAAPDAWHASKGYNAGRSISAITVHKDRGEISRNKVNITDDEEPLQR